MTALAASNPDIAKLQDSTKNVYPVAASTTIYQGAMVVLNYLGQVIPAASSLQGHLRVVGVSNGRLQPGANSPIDANDAVAVSAGDYNVEVEHGKFSFVNGSTVDAITSADIGALAYAIDDQTVSRGSLDGNRPVVGVIKTLQDDGRVAVDITGHRWYSTVVSMIADADLSLLRNSQVKLADSSGVGRIASSATDTSQTIGILINAPDAAGKQALVVTAGPAPCVVGSGGITSANRVAATTSGASVSAGAAKTFVGSALETGTSAQTKMVLVAPGVMPA